MRFALFAGRRRKRAMESIYDVMERHRQELLRREAKTVRRMIRLYRAAELAIAEALRDVTESLAQAEAADIEVSPDWLFQQSRWQTLERIILERMADLAPELITAARAGLTTALQTASSHVDEAASVLSVSFKRIPVKAIERSLGLMEPGSAYVKWFERAGLRGVEDAREVFIKGMAKGENPRKIARQLMREGIVREKVSAVATARLVSLTGYRSFQRENFAANADVVAGSRIVSARDDRTCWRCLAQDGKILAHGEDYFTHIGCRCGLMPVLIVGDVPRETGEEWLRSQPEAVQLAKLGPGRWALWNSGKVSLHDMLKFQTDPEWGPEVREYNLRELNEMVKRDARPPAPKTKVTNGMPSY